MQVITLRIRQSRLAGLMAMLLVSSGFALFTALTALIAIPLWFTPVPVTLQVLAALLAGLVLGPRLGALSQVQYLILGLSGVPVFAQGKAGIAAFLGPTGGYLLGFVALAFVAGLVYERGASLGRWRSLAASFAGVAVIYVTGAGWLAVWMGFITGTGQMPSFAAVFAAGVAPFILIDLGKALICGLVLDSGKRLLAKLPVL